MPFPTIDASLIDRADGLLRSQEYMSLDVPPEDKKKQTMAYLVIEKSGSSLHIHLFTSAEMREEYIDSHLGNFLEV